MGKVIKIKFPLKYVFMIILKLCSVKRLCVLNKNYKQDNYKENLCVPCVKNLQQSHIKYNTNENNSSYRHHRRKMRPTLQR